jgi:hypothetical protein
MPEESTTPDLVEITRRLYAAGNRRDVAAVLSCCTGDAVFDATDAGLSNKPNPHDPEAHLAA